MPLKKWAVMCNYEKDSWKNNKTHKSHLPHPLHSRIFTLIEKRILKKSSSTGWDEGKMFDLSGNIQLYVLHLKSCMDSITPEVIERFVCERTGEICILIFKSCLLELSHCKQWQHRSGTLLCVEVYLEEQSYVNLVIGSLQYFTLQVYNEVLEQEMLCLHFPATHRRAWMWFRFCTEQGGLLLLTVWNGGKSSPCIPSQNSYACLEISYLLIHIQCRWHRQN